MKNGSTTTSNTVYELYSDHLGTATFSANLTGEIVSGSQVKFFPFGGYRVAPTAGLNNKGFTGHQHNDDLGLIYMNARYYLPETGRFLSADSVVPNPANPQAYNRYSYVYNNPILYTDPSGHCAFVGIDTLACMELALAFGLLVVAADYVTDNNIGKAVANTAQMIGDGVEYVIESFDTLEEPIPYTTEFPLEAPSLPNVSADPAFNPVGPIIEPFPLSDGPLLPPHQPGPDLNNLAGPLILAASAKGLIGVAFEDWLANQYGGYHVGWVSGANGGREFDVQYGNTLIEAKSGNYWNNPLRVAKFMSSAGHQLQIAIELGLNFEVHSNVPIPQWVKDWMSRKGIPFIEHLDE